LSGKLRHFELSFLKIVLYQCYIFNFWIGLIPNIDTALDTVAAKNEALVNGQQGYCLLHALEFLFRAPEFLFHAPDFNSHALLQMSHATMLFFGRHNRHYNVTD